ncbi:hypothetical protein STENM223S_01225 [Streptomyces tendae]
MKSCADAARTGRPWRLRLEDRALLVAAYWRTNLTMRQIAPLFGVSKSTADHRSPRTEVRTPAPQAVCEGHCARRGRHPGTHRDHKIAERSKNYRYSTNHQVVVDADTRLVVVVGRPLAGNRNDCKAWAESGAKTAVGKTLTIADGGYPGTGLVIPHRRERGQTELPAWKEEHNRSHRQVRARVEHVFARMKTWKILRDCRLKGDGVHHAMLGIARIGPLRTAAHHAEMTRRSFTGRPLGRRTHARADDVRDAEAMRSHRTAAAVGVAVAALILNN